MFVSTGLKFYSCALLMILFILINFSNPMSKRDNLALCANFVTKKICFPCRGMYMKPLFSPKHTEDKFFLFGGGEVGGRR